MADSVEHASLLDMVTSVHEILTYVRVRKLGAAAAAVLTMVGLSACETKVGQAAVVQGHRLSDSNLSNYVRSGAKPYTDSSTNASVYPKLYALESWVDDQLFERAVESKGGRVTSAELTATRSVVLGTETSDALVASFAKRGYTEQFVMLAIHEQQMIVLVLKRLAPKATYAQILSALQNGQANGALLSAVQKAKSAVSVSPRYGKWDPKTLSLTDSRGAGPPSFITFLSNDVGSVASVPPSTG